MLERVDHQKENHFFANYLFGNAGRMKNPTSHLKMKYHTYLWKIKFLKPNSEKKFSE